MNSRRGKNEEVLAEVLDLFLLPDYNVVSTTYLDHLLTHIAENTKECATVDYEYCEVFQKWIPKALAIWESGQKASQPVITFTLKLVGIISRHELRYHYWQCQDVYNRLYKVLQLHREDLPASIKMAYTTMLSNLIVHRSGRHYQITTLFLNAIGVWKDVVKYAHWNQTMYVTRESQKFLWTLLLHEQKNTETCKEIILTVAAPLMSNILNVQMHQALEETYLEQNKLLCSTLDLLTSIMENTLFASLDNSIPELIERLVDLEMRVKALFEACISTRFLQHVHKLLLLSLFLKLKQGIKENTTMIDIDAWHKFCYGLCYISMMLLSKKDIIELVKNNKFSMTYWKKLLTLREFVLPEEHKFEHQAIALMIIPLCVCIKKNHLNHDLFDMFVSKIFDVTCTTVQRLAYSMRDIIRKGDLPMEQICKVSIDILLEISDIMDRDVAVIAFQALCHVLKSYMPDMCGQARNCTSSDINSTSPSENPRKFLYKSILDGDPIVNYPILLASLLDGLAVMTEKFKLKWQECVETICVLSLAQEILNHPGILPTICVKALKLCKLAIHNFMPPNLALLVDSDSHMNEIGPTLFKRLHDPNWEVRDSVLEVLNTIATISEYKYPAFQDFLLINEFPKVAVDIIKTDDESYVRASALTFVATMIRINKLWEQQLSQETAIDLLRNESEAIVRREAVTLIKELYVHQNWSKEVINSMLRAMCIAAVFDLHWEVKTNALSFWDHFVKSHLTDQGMLDNCFPNVTFSKEHRKIVALNETEIKRRLNKALDELARQSCLGVLLVTLKDDSDFEVCKVSAAIIGKLKTCLLKYKLDEPSSPVENHSVIDTVYVKETPSILSSIYDEKMQNVSNIIEEIVDTNDANLLATIYKNSMNMDTEMVKEEEKEEKKTLRYISSVTRQDFLHAIFNWDIDAYIEEKNRWLKTYTSSFESILDDILTMYKQNDVNSMDCY
ncbi:BRCA1-associated protein required for ATM activation protein 1 [Temnothorax longispinosus]|uniref:BRCA1-associated protein required for ATM activation protein 1 n=1 Tax=Temnothorax longispinosus TaxID=300112 RepID=A0A4S2KJK5_9HYME|nr:BRCA1-associated protein required for ATM activation protein 1 [Temnothorax longispinosus]